MFRMGFFGQTRFQWFMFRMGFSGRTKFQWVMFQSDLDMGMLQVSEIVSFCNPKL
jgi:hypothetical protein